MAEFSITGFIVGVRYLEQSVLVTVSENTLGFTRADGTIVEESVDTWCIIYKPYFKKYISSHFSRGMYVRIKGTIRPFSLNHNKAVDGYSVIGETINLAAFPKSSVRQEKRLTQNPAVDVMGEPNYRESKEMDF